MATQRQQEGERRIWVLEFKTGAQRQLRDIAKRNPPIAESIARKVRWLTANVEAIDHEKLCGREEYSLHIGQYRVLYELDWQQRRITIVRVGAHNAAYRR